MRYYCITPIKLNEIPGTLNDLFKMWRKAQQNDPIYNQTCPMCPNGKITAIDFIKSFCIDGFTSSKGNEASDIIYENRPLFILKESDLANNNRIESNGKGFWFNEPKPEDKTRGKYNKRLCYCLERLGESKNSIFGYINLNKRGGFGRTNPTRLNNYVQEFKEFITCQIEIMNPSKVFCCGCYNTFMEICFQKESWGKCEKPGRIKVNGKDVLVYYIHHPASPNFYASVDKLYDENICNS